MINLIVACAFFSSAMPGSSVWQIATMHAESGGYLPEPGPLCRMPGETVTIVLVSESNITTLPPVTVNWFTNYDMDGNGRIGTGDVLMQTNITDFGAASMRLGECNDGQQIKEC